ncbi:DUF397 domain-containing protein [Streptomyces sp. NPDC046261]|uniref:DUF397 domain-containing protein n=1 Tax=Streptomyces sp. NPDC046261 TaxID=3157200 RepID=UPI0033C7E716
MIRHHLPLHQWRKSSHSGDEEAQCVEAQPTDDALIAIGDSKSRARGAFVFTPAAWSAFTGAVDRGELDPRSAPPGQAPG